LRPTRVLLLGMTLVMALPSPKIIFDCLLPAKPPQGTLRFCP
jgi:hypothetical protein